MCIRDRNADDLFSLAGNILVPFSNRISGGGFDWAGIHHPLEQNFAGDPFPIHGDAFQREWTLQHHPTGAQMDLAVGAFGPWRYRASQIFHLSETGVKIELSVTNTGASSLPFGCGFHPWFPRSAETRLRFSAKEVWMEDERHLTTEQLCLSDAPEWSFALGRALPETLINNA